MTNFNSEGIKLDTQPPTISQLTTSLVDTFSYISYNVRDSKKFVQGLLNLRNLDEQILGLDGNQLAEMIYGLQNRIGEFIGNEQKFINGNFQDLSENASKEIAFIPQQTQNEAAKWPSSSDPDTLPGGKNRDQKVSINRATNNISDMVESVRRNVSSKSESSLSEMASLGAALGHVVTLQQQRLEAQTQDNP